MLSKNIFKNKAFWIVLFVNPWIVKVCLSQPLIAILLIVTTLSLISVILEHNLHSKVIFIVTFVVLVILQVKTSEYFPLHLYDFDSEIISSQRVGLYQPINIGPESISLGYWLEKSTPAVIRSNILKNMSLVFDPNYYFFANHPRERVGVVEFEKFVYILIPFLVYGIYLSWGVKNKRWFLYPLAISLLVLAVVGNNNLLGSFLMFPFMVFWISYGLGNISARLKNTHEQRIKFLEYLFWILFILATVQIYI